ncbi:hypothetical protein F4780DRAFT_774566 [Xylariomycetidae sp. FL0641]|nr:hypothetical protein F4780DRAFT_774566 [Xylariomycetidae sp. FL0641]
MAATPITTHPRSVPSLDEPVHSAGSVPEPSSAHAVRSAVRNGALRGPTTGLAPGYLQANLIVLPRPRLRRGLPGVVRARNPVPCPLLGELPRLFDEPSQADVRRDAPRHNVYVDGALSRAGVPDVVDDGDEDGHLLVRGGAGPAPACLPARHLAHRRDVTMCRTTVPLCAAGAFAGATLVVSMRAYAARDVEAVQGITRAYAATHGEPVAWGWDALERLGIRDIDDPQWGDAPLTVDGRPLGEEARRSRDEVPVFGAVVLPPQEAVMRAGMEGTVLAHAPGHMLVLDARDEDITAA